jgi:hypothetical protein
MSVKGQQSFVVGEVHPSGSVLCDIPNLRSSPISLFGIVDDPGYPNGVLGRNGHGTGKEDN